MLKRKELKQEIEDLLEEMDVNDLGIVAVFLRQISGKENGNGTNCEHGGGIQENDYIPGK